MKLNELQVIYIQEQLKKKGLDYQPLEDEILDHFCCKVEEEMGSGQKFIDAFQKVTASSFDEKQIQKVQTDTQLLNSKKTRFMKFTSSLAASITALLAIILFTNASDAPSIKPFNQGERIRMTSPFGERMHPIKKKRMHHNGVDFAMPLNTPIMASADGEIVEVTESDTGYGNRVVVKHDEIYSSIYAQLSKSIVEEGQQVKKGEIIAYSGNSGSSTGPHLHYEVLKDGKPVDPEQFF